MEKKVGLAVTTYTYNYGSFLQSFALSEVIKKLGYHPIVISTEGVHNLISIARKKYFLSRIFNINELKSYSTVFKGMLMRIVDKKYVNDLNTRRATFDRFRDKYFTFSPVGYSWEEVGQICRDYTAVVVGSDQLWRPANIEGNYFTLNFVPEEVNKVAYATSFGIPFLPKKQANKARQFLPRLNHIAVREEKGAEIIKNLTDMDVRVVCDPTLLLTKEEWDDNVGKRMLDYEYILCYYLGDNENYLRFANRLKEYLGVKIVGLVHINGYNKNVQVYMDETPFDVDPFQFINLIKYAKCVLTDSFHCSVFSILFEKEFFAFKRFKDSDTMSTNNRLFTLFKMAGIEGRIIEGTECVDSKLFTKINYEVVRENLELKRTESLDYLVKSLANL